MRSKFQDSDSSFSPDFAKLSQLMQLQLLAHQQNGWTAGICFLYLKDVYILYVLNVKLYKY